jgi:hypothetical protein
MQNHACAAISDEAARAAGYRVSTNYLAAFHGKLPQNLKFLAAASTTTRTEEMKEQRPTKRVRRARSTSSSASSEDAAASIDAMEIFRRHFESRFEAIEDDKPEPEPEPEPKATSKPAAAAAAA